MKEPSDLARDYKFAFFPPSPDIEHSELFRVAYHFRTSEAHLRDMLPAVLGQFLIFFTGTGELVFPKGNVETSHKCFFIAPMTMAAEYQLSGPLHAVGIGLSELGWAELTGISAKDCANTTIAALDVLGEEVTPFAQNMSDAYLAGQITPHGVAKAMIAFLQPRFSRQTDEVRELITTTRAWATDSLKPDVHQLYAAFPYSKRKVQRLVLRHFGQSPTQLARRLRGVFAASALNHMTITPELDAQIGDSFFDQADMIRAVKEAAGRTPTRIGRPNESVLSDILQPESYLGEYPKGTEPPEAGD